MQQAALNLRDGFFDAYTLDKMGAGQGYNRTVEKLIGDSTTKFPIFAFLKPKQRPNG